MLNGHNLTQKCHGTFEVFKNYYRSRAYSSRRPWPWRDCALERGWLSDTFDHYKVVLGHISAPLKRTTVMPLPQL
jgi:hypothetical protein